MRKILFTVLLFIIVLNLSSSINAQVESVGIEDVIFEDGSITEKITIKMIENDTNSSFFFAFPNNAYDIIIDGNSTQNRSVRIPLNCTACEMNISYRIDDIIQNEGRRTYSFSRTLNFPEQPKLLIYQIRIPNGYMLEIGGDEPSIVPQGELKTDGSNIIVFWEQEDPNLPQIYHIRYQQSRSSWSFYVLMLLIGIAIGSVSAYFLTRKFSSSPVMSSDDGLVPSSLLSPDEKEIILLLQKHKGNMNQRDMVRELQWSKSKVSGVLSNLDYKKVIEREKLGRNYKVNLVKRIIE